MTGSIATRTFFLPQKITSFDQGIRGQIVNSLIASSEEESLRTSSEVHAQQAITIIRAISQNIRFDKFDPSWLALNSVVQSK